MDGPFYLDTREPFFTVPTTAITLAATAKALYTAAQFPPLGAGYMSRPGKKLRIRLAGIMTTGATPGNGSFNVYWGTGADANGVLLMTGTPVALTAGQTALTWELEIVITCITTGATGTARCSGHALFNEAILAPHQMLPTATMADSASIDFTAALIPSVQFLRSGSTGETMQVREMEVTALN